MGPGVSRTPTVSLVRRVLALAALSVLVSVLAAPAGRAQVVDPCQPVPVPGLCDVPVPTPTPLPTPGASPSPSPSEDDPDEGSGGEKGGGKAKDGDGKTSEGGGGSAVIPGTQPTGAPFAISGPNSSAQVIALLSQLEPYGIPISESVLDVVGPFPVAGAAWWTDDWHAPRSGGRLHQGLDIFAPFGTPIVASADGVISQKAVGSLCGLGIEITDAQGVEYYHCHLSAYVEGVEIGTTVKVGQVIGYIGNSGNAISTPPHVHFEFQPGGIPHPPKPWVDRWVRIAEQRALALVQQVAGTLPAERSEDFRLTRLFDLSGGAGTQVSAGAQLLLLAGLQPGVSSLEVAQRALDDMAWEIDWNGTAGDQLAALVDDYRSYIVSEELIGLSEWPFGASGIGPAPAPATTDGSD